MSGRAGPPRPWRSCGAGCRSTRCSRPGTATSGTPWPRSGVLPKRSSSGAGGSASPRGRRRSSRSRAKCDAPRPRRKRSRTAERGSMADEIKTLSAELARDPQSLVFLRLADLLRQRGQLDAAHRVALNGLERHPHLADAHDLYARILADKRDYQRAFDEWDMARRIAPGHMGALKGLAFLYFKVGDVAQAVAHLEEAERVAPDDFTIQQALAMVRGQPMGSAAARPAGHAAALRPDAPPPPPLPQEPMAPPARPLEDRRPFARLGGAPEGLLLPHAAGPGAGGAPRAWNRG